MDESAREAAQLVELRVSLSEARQELGRLRADLAPLTSLPTLLKAQQDLVRHQLRSIEDRIEREVAQHQQDVEDVRKDIAELMDWKTWSLRLVVGAVLLALVGLAIASPGVAT